MKASSSPGQSNDRIRVWTWVLVAIAALFAGFVLGLRCGQTSGGSRIGWPPPPAVPRSPGP